MKRELLLSELKNNVVLINKAIEALDHSLKKIRKIDFDKDLDFELLEICESFSSRFARLSDLFTQKYLKTFFHLLGESHYTLIDKANFIKKHISKYGEDIVAIRDLRNEITHEYIVENLNDLYEESVELSEKLITIIKDTFEYSKMKLF